MACTFLSTCTVRLLTISIAILQCIAGINGIFTLTNYVTLEFPPLFISAYAILFAVPLIMFECKCTFFQTALRQSCGFMYHFYGRAAYFVIIAFLDIGIPGGLGIVVALLITLTLFIMFSLRCFGVTNPHQEEIALTTRTVAQDYKAVASSKTMRKIVKLASSTTEL
ncbi:hypothetical protein THRCLA_21109 [Thraustotheca clavata]|uniref:COPI associated protein n=1 Tax=Thraustotheca clavata TaxID=74557 RepID=A0A1W0A0X0_9STRA|nr:hypothetical protein THRCLA_21109 [Thraustotheca clavata]